MILARLNALGASIITRIEGFGAFVRFAAAGAAMTVTAPMRWGRPHLIVPQFFEVGTRSIPVVMLVGAFVGMVLAVEMYGQFAALGQESRIGGVINISVVKQIGPVLAAVMIAGRVGGSFSAQLGTMRVTEQIDAMRAMGVDPIVHLVVPRVVACLLMVPLLTVFSNMLGIVGGYLVTVYGFNVNAREYWEFSARFVDAWDLFTGLFKATIFGLCIGLISTYKGFTCQPGAAGVGRATTDAFVISFIAIIIANFFLATFLKDLGSALFGGGAAATLAG